MAAALSHKMPTGEDRPIGFASKNLAQAEQNHSHLEKEAVVVVFGVKRLHEYCFGRLFTIQPDHKPMLGTIGEHKGISITSTAQIQG